MKLISVKWWITKTYKITKMKSKSYWLKTKKGNVASVSFATDKKPSKETINALNAMVDIAFNKLKKSTLPIK